MSELVKWPEEKKRLTWPDLLPGEFFAFVEKPQLVCRTNASGTGGYVHWLQYGEQFSACIQTWDRGKEVVPLDLTTPPQFTVRQ